MLADPFPGAHELRQQAAAARVRSIDAEGSIAFDSAADVPAGTGYQSPVTAIAEDEDGVQIEMGLLVRDGKLSELDVWKGDGSPIKKWPSAARVQVLVTVPGYSGRSE